MEKIDKSHLAEMLGVEEDQKWNYPGLFGPYRVHNGAREYWDENNGWLACDCEEDLIKIIAHPERIIRTTRLTDAELAICNAVGAKWVSRATEGGTKVSLWTVKPFKTFHGVYVASGIDAIARVNASLFPSVKMGDLIGLSQLPHLN